MTSMYLDKGGCEELETHGAELSIHYSRLFRQIISSKKRDKTEWSESIKEDITNAFTILLNKSLQASCSVKMIEEGMFEKVALKAKESCETHFYLLQTSNDKDQAEIYEQECI